MICRDPACAFVHIPKTGGTSIEHLLTGHDWITANADDYAVYLAERDRYRSDWGGTLCAGDPNYFTRNLARKHASQAELREQVGAPAWDGLFKFTFVRNPWERFLSIYEHGMRDGAERMPESFSEWIASPEPEDHMGQPVFRNLVDNWDELDFAGRFERLAADFAKVAVLLGLSGDVTLPHERHGSGGQHDLSRYDADAVDVVARRCAEEIDRFGYRFEG
jgi:hypothetical protein